MSLAQDSLRKGDKQDALKFAQKANDIAQGAKLKFGPGELSPAAFIAQLQGKEKPATANTRPATPSATTAKNPLKSTSRSLPDWASETNTIVTASAQEEVPSVIAAAHEIPEATPNAPL